MPLIIEKEPTYKEELVGFVCDCCGESFSINEDIFEMQEFFHFRNFCGYGSIFGDGSKVEIVLCQHCAKDLLGNFIRINNEC